MRPFVSFGTRPPTHPPHPRAHPPMSTVMTLRPCRVPAPQWDGDWRPDKVLDRQTVQPHTQLRVRLDVNLGGPWTKSNAFTLVVLPKLNPSYGSVHISKRTDEDIYEHPFPLTPDCSDCITYVSPCTSLVVGWVRGGRDASTPARSYGRPSAAGGRTTSVGLDMLCCVPKPLTRSTAAVTTCRAG